MKINLLAVAASLFVFNMSGLSDCGENPLFFITSQSFEPSVPKVGDNVSWTISYVVPENVVAINSPRSINSGTINGFIPIEPTESDLCEILECPIYPGEYSSTSYMTWPDGLGGAKLSLTSEWVDENDSELLCSKVVVTGKTNLRGNNTKN